MRLGDGVEAQMTVLATLEKRMRPIGLTVLAVALGLAWKACTTKTDTSSVATAFVGSAAATIKGGGANERLPAEHSRSKARMPVAGYVGSWIGNSFPGGGLTWQPPFRPYVQPQINDITVARDGTVYANNYYDEASLLMAMYRNGVPAPMDCGGLTTGGGWAAASNSKYVFMSYIDSHNNAGVERFTLKGAKAPFAGGASSNRDGCGNAVVVEGGDRYGKVDSQPKVAAIYGMAASREELYVGDGIANEIKVYSVDTMRLTRSWPVKRPRRIAYDPNTKSVWVGIGSSRPTGSFAGGHILHFDLNGKPLPGTIKSVAIPMGMAMDGPTLLVADAGPDMQIKRFDASGRQIGSLGVRDGFLAGPVPGVMAGERLAYPDGLGVDGRGNIYVSESMYFGNYDKEAGYGLFGVSALGAAYDSGLVSLGPSGQVRWSVFGRGGQAAAADPATDGRDVYTLTGHYKMDYSKPDGREQTLYSQTLDAIHYPLDIRIAEAADNAIPTIVQVINVKGHKYMFSSDQYSGIFGVYRFDGEIAAPQAMFSRRRLDFWGDDVQPDGASLWYDANGNGSPDAGEFSRSPFLTAQSTDFVPDANGDIWIADTDESGVVEFPMAGLDRYGGLTWNSPKVFGNPPSFSSVHRLEYVAPADVLYVSGYTASSPKVSTPYGRDVAGTTLARYDHWLASGGKSMPTWTSKLPCNGANAIMSWAVAGQKIFAGLFESSGNGPNIYVYNAGDGDRVGEMHPGRETNHYMGWLDGQQVLEAYRRSDGEYLVFEEEEMNAKVTVLRGRLENFTQH
jgi:hypothetical protein